MSNVEAYAIEHGLQDILPTLRKGTLAGQDPIAASTSAMLSGQDLDVLHVEATRRWHQPWALYYTIILNSIAAAIQGWDQTGKHTTVFSLTSIRNSSLL
jgi:hypothetical protein